MFFLSDAVSHYWKYFCKGHPSSDCILHLPSCGYHCQVKSRKVWGCSAYLKKSFNKCLFSHCCAVVGKNTTGDVACFLHYIYVTAGDLFFN